MLRMWSDVDSDGWSDLLVTCEWGPVRLFSNRKGALEDVTRKVAFAEHFGWWNSIVGGDFDADGDIDYATMNVGLNTKYGHATAKKPAILYRGDMDGNGGFDLVEAKASSEHGELPVRGRSCSCNAMPILREKFPTYRQFALSSLEGSIRILSWTMQNESPRRNSEAVFGSTNRLQGNRSLGGGRLQLMRSCHPALVPSSRISTVDTGQP